MNKISMNHQIEAKREEWKIDHDQELDLPVETNEIHYIISVEKGIHCNLNIVGRDLNVQIEITQKEGSHVKLSSFLEDSTSSVVVKLKGKDSIVEYANSCLNEKDTTSHIAIYHQASNTKSFVFCNGFSQSHAKILFDVNGYVEKESSNCSCIQDSKIIEMEDSLSQIDPNLYIENYDVEASHSAYVGPFDKEELFYLKSRGIREEQAIKLLVKSLLLGKIQVREEMKSKLIEKIENQKLNKK